MGLMLFSMFPGEKSSGLIEANAQGELTNPRADVSGGEIPRPH